MLKDDFKITKINQKYSKTTERNIPSVEFPALRYMETQRLFPKLKEGGNTINARGLQDHLLRGGQLSARDVMLIVSTATRVFQSEPNILSLDVPVNICGDVSGQVQDLSKLFEVGGSIDTSSYLFLGNYCNSGNSCVETLTLLYALKILNRNKLFLIRGNRDSRLMGDFSDLKRQCITRFGVDVYQAILASFDALPLAAVVNRQFFCVHGGLSPELTSLDDVRAVNRFREPPPFGLMCDLLWADPAGEYAPTSRDHFELNNRRECSYEFTYFAACDFLEKNKLLSVVRAGQPLEDGFKMLSVRENTGFPTVISIYSAPNALGVAKNKGAILHYDKSELNIRQFTESPASTVSQVTVHVQDAFSWSLPFVAQKTVDLVLGLLKICLNEEDEDEEKEGNGEENNNGDNVGKSEQKNVSDEKISDLLRNEKTSKHESENYELLKRKIAFLEGYRKALGDVRDRSEMSKCTLNSLSAKGISPNDDTLGGKPAYVSRDNIKSFKEAMEFDAPNCVRPVCELDQELLDNINNGLLPEEDEEDEEEDEDDASGSYSTDEEEYDSE